MLVGRDQSSIKYSRSLPIESDRRNNRIYFPLSGVHCLDGLDCGGSWMSCKRLVKTWGRKRLPFCIPLGSVQLDGDSRFPNSLPSWLTTLCVSHKEGYSKTSSLNKNHRSPRCQSLLFKPSHMLSMDLHLRISTTELVFILYMTNILNTSSTTLSMVINNVQ